MASQDARLSKFEADFKQQQSEMTNKIDTVLKAIIDRIAGALPSDTVKNPKLSASLVLSARSYPNMDSQCSNHVQGSINTITIHSEKQSDSYDENAKENEKEEKDSLENIHVNPSTPPDLLVAFITEKGDDGEVMFIELIRKNDDSSEGEPEEEGSTTTEGLWNSSLGKIYLGEDVVVISSDKVEGSVDWNSMKFQDTANKAYDVEINLRVEENMISNEYVVKLCLEHKVKRGNKIVKKELIVALRGEIYFVKFIINLEEDIVEPGSKDDWDHLLDFNIDDIPLLGEKGLPPFVCKMGKSSRNKKRATKDLNFFYQDIGTSSSAEGHLTQEEASKEAIAIRIIWKDKVELDGKIIKEEEEAVKRIKGEALKEKEHPGAFIFPIRLERQVGVTTLIAKFLILDILIDRDSPIVVGRGFLQSDSDDEEEYQIKRNKIGAPIYGL
ncbi:hypothetical protein Tco_0780546 [Tanacetum coccineum]